MMTNCDSRDGFFYKSMQMCRCPNEALSIGQFKRWMTRFKHPFNIVFKRPFNRSPSINLVSATRISVSGNVGKAPIDAMSTDHLNASAAMAPTTSTTKYLSRGI